MKDAHFYLKLRKNQKHLQNNLDTTNFFIKFDIQGFKEMRE